MRTAEYWIEQLQLKPHPEGGFFRETYRATETIAHPALPSRFSGQRNFSTAIYFLLRSQDRSRFHRIKSDELWCFHTGHALSIYRLDDQGLTICELGDDPEKHESLQEVIPAGSWFGARLEEEGSYALVSCMVAPGFDFADFEIGSRDELIGEFPEHGEVIGLLT